MYIKNIDKDEIRSGFLVTTDRKKLWNKELELLLEFDRICQKHKITYVIGSATLMGAARHGGFVPWSDHIDLYLSRPDYMKLQEIMPWELEYPYRYDTPYTNRMLNDKCNLIDVNTTAYFLQGRLKGQATGCFLDIFSMEVGLNPRLNYPQEIENLPLMIRDLLLLAIDGHYEEHRAIYKPILSESTISQIRRLDFSERYKIYEDFLLANYEATDYVQNIFLNDMSGQLEKGIYSKNDFFSLIELDFEGLKLPAPACYDKVLQDEYGNWQVAVEGDATHEGLLMYSTDIPFVEFLQEIIA